MLTDQRRERHRRKLERELAAACARLESKLPDTYSESVRKRIFSQRRNTVMRLAKELAAWVRGPIAP